MTKAIIHTHWLFGNGPDKIVNFNHPVREESHCQECIHNKVCSHNMEARCKNYILGTSDRGCQGCLHRYTRFDKDETKIPCFYCPDFMPKVS